MTDIGPKNFIKEMTQETGLTNGWESCEREPPKGVPFLDKTYQRIVYQSVQQEQSTVEINLTYGGPNMAGVWTLFCCQSYPGNLNNTLLKMFFIVNLK